MKKLYYLATICFVVAGVLLLCKPTHASTPAAAGAPVAVAPFVPTRFTVTDSGTPGKPEAVLIPGLGSSSAVWDHEASLLAPNYRLHVLQIAGFAGAPVAGNAEANGPLLPGIVEELHRYITQHAMHPVVIGHSLGGLLALMLADKYPADAAKLVIVDSLPFYAVVYVPDATVASMRPQAETVKAQMAAMPADQFAAMQPVMIPQMVKDTTGQKLVAASNIASDRTVFVNAMYEDLQTDLRPDVASIKTPTLMIYPYDASVAKDPAKIEAVYKTAYAAMPNVKLVRIDDSRHFIMYDQPAKLDAAIQAFLK